LVSSSDSVGLSLSRSVPDNGAVNAVKLKKSLFAAGIVSVEGQTFDMNMSEITELLCAGDFTDNSSITLFDLEGQVHTLIVAIAPVSVLARKLASASQIIRQLTLTRSKERDPRSTET